MRSLVFETPPLDTSLEILGAAMIPAGPVLKHAVSHWLQRMDDVLAFASARPVDGGTGAHMSSQISTWNTKSAMPLAWNRRSVPNGARWSATTISRPTTPAPGANQRCS